MTFPSGLEIAVLFVLLLANGLFAMSELAIVSARKPRLRQWANEGKAGAKEALALALSPNDFLSTVQIGITLVGILSGAFGGATLSDDVERYLILVPGLAPYSRGLSIGIVVACITYLSLIIGELAPKRLALGNAERIACLVAGPMQVLARFGGPLVRVLAGSTDALIRLFGIKPSDAPTITEQEIHLLVEEGKEAGIFHGAEQKMVLGVFRLDERKVTSVMTPSTDLVWLNTNDPPKKILETIQATTHTRFPVAEGTIDKFIGVVKERDLFLAWLSTKQLDIASLVHQPLFFPESKTALEVLELFKESKSDVAFVLDEYGGLRGMVTISDIVAAVLGELPLPGDEAKWEATQREDGSWLLDGMTPIDEFKRIFNISELPGEQEGYETLAGFILYQLESVPEVGQSLEWEKLQFEVVDMDGYRVDKILVSTKEQPVSSSAEAEE